MEIDGDLTGWPGQSLPQRDIKRLLLWQATAAPVEFRRLWANLVGSYSACELIRDEDKLPAISGLARVLRVRRPNQYFLSGLWNAGLSEQLLWIPGIRSLGPKFSERAPSWSWASLNDPVRFLELRDLIKDDGLDTYAISSSAFDENDAWVDGPCTLKVRGSVVEWDSWKMGLAHGTYTRSHVCLAQNSDLGEQVSDPHFKVQVLSLGCHPDMLMVG